MFRRIVFLCVFRRFAFNLTDKLTTRNATAFFLCIFPCFFVIKHACARALTKIFFTFQFSHGKTVIACWALIAGTSTFISVRHFSAINVYLNVVVEIAVVLFRSSAKFHFSLACITRSLGGRLFLRCHPTDWREHDLFLSQLHHLPSSLIHFTCASIVLTHNRNGPHCMSRQIACNSFIASGALRSSLSIVTSSASTCRYCSTAGRVQIQVLVDCKNSIDAIMFCDAHLMSSQKTNRLSLQLR